MCSVSAAPQQVARSHTMVQNHTPQYVDVLQQQEQQQQTQQFKSHGI